MGMRERAMGADRSTVEAMRYVGIDRVNEILHELSKVIVTIIVVVTTRTIRFMFSGS